MRFVLVSVITIVLRHFYLLIHQLLTNFSSGFVTFCKDSNSINNYLRFY